VLRAGSAGAARGGDWALVQAKPAVGAEAAGETVISGQENNSTMKNIMLDLETLGNKPGAVIVAIGAVRFGKGQISETFYNRVDAQSCVDAGLKLDVSTVLWWLKQSDAARAELNQPGEHLADALQAFQDFVREDDLIWGNGSDFDNTILAAAYEALRLAVPWKFWNNRCYRTLKALRPDIKLKQPGVAHNAQHDAQAQAHHLMQMFPEF
jgi:DNA polymerase III epsilon subunit-like protein